MGLFNRFMMKTRTVTLGACTSGEVIPMEQIADPVFAEGILGPCAGIAPMESVVVAPAEGVVTQVADGLHAMGLRIGEDVDVLIHVGIDTVQMMGEGFRVLVSEGERVRPGQPLIIFDREKIKEAGYADTVIVAVTEGESQRKTELLAQGFIRAGDGFLKVSR